MLGDGDIVHCPQYILHAGETGEEFLRVASIEEWHIKLRCITQFLELDAQRMSLGAGEPSEMARTFAGLPIAMRKNPFGDHTRRHFVRANTCQSARSLMRRKWPPASVTNVAHIAHEHAQTRPRDGGECVAEGPFPRLLRAAAKNGKGLLRSVGVSDRFQKFGYED